MLETFIFMSFMRISITIFFKETKMMNVWLPISSFLFLHRNCVSDLQTAMLTAVCQGIQQEAATAVACSVIAAIRNVILCHILEMLVEMMVYRFVMDFCLLFLNIIKHNTISLHRKLYYCTFYVNIRVLSFSMHLERKKPCMCLNSCKTRAGEHPKS